MKIKSILLFAALIFVLGARGQAIKYSDSVELYYGSGQFEKAKYFAEKHLEEASNQSKQDSNYTVALNNLGSVYYALAKYPLALPYYQEALEIQRKNGETSSSDLATTLQNIGNIYSALNQIELAEKFQLEALAIYKKTNDTSDDFINLLNNMGFLNVNKSNFSLARKYYLEALKYRKQLSGEESLGYALILNNLGVLNVTIGNYAEAETMHQKALAIRRKPPIRNIPDYAFSLSNLASLYSQLGNYEAAEPLMLEALKLREFSLGTKHPDYATSLNNLAVFYLQQQKYQQGDSLFKKAVSIFKNSFGEKHYNYLSILSSWATTNGKRGNYVFADSLYKVVLGLYEKIGAETGLPYAFSLKDMARNLHFMGKDSAAAIFSQKAIDIYNKRVDSTYSDYILTQVNLVDALNKLHNYEKAENIAISVSGSERQKLVDRLAFLSENELISFIRQSQILIDLTLQTLGSYCSEKLSKTIYNNALFFKGAVLSNATSFPKILSLLNDTLVDAKWRNFKLNKILFNKQLALPFSRRTVNTDSMAIVVNGYEKELVRISSSYKNITNQIGVVWSDVKKNLGKYEAAIEFVKYTKRKSSLNEDDSVFYAAVIVTSKANSPVVVRILEERELLKAIDKFVYKAKYPIRGISNQSITFNNNLYNILWKPLQPFLKSTKTIYFSPDGLLHQLAFAAIPYGKDSLLCDKYNLVQVTSTRQLAIKDSINNSPKSFALFGGIDYNNQATDTTSTKLADPYSYVYQQNRSAELDSFSYLPSTKTEVNTIAQKTQTTKSKYLLFTGIGATEAAFRSLSGNASPEVIHIATHGFTLADAAKQKDGLGSNVFRTSENPLLRCGLVLAGGNKGWKGKAGLNEDDGILTGLEISNVLLPNTKLAVLSACETGIGELKGSEGIFGLQRAFKLAGVNYIMASLWQVPDKETSEFMNLFYSQWLAGKTIQQSFNETQKIMRKKYAPYYWAGFTLVH